MIEFTQAMFNLRASLIEGGASEAEVNAKILSLGTELKPAMHDYPGNKQGVINIINATSLLTADEKTNFITDIT